MSFQFLLAKLRYRQLARDFLYCFITGEVSEQIPAIAFENNIAFVSAGHHATERYGVGIFYIEALCKLDIVAHCCMCIKWQMVGI
jgi:putative NIF3 family GTP cyclohydrolase 1 type 2